MRIVFNRLTAMGIKTGIGHYTVELLRHLADEAGEDQIDVFPSPLFWRLRGLVSRLSPLEPRERGQGTPASRPGHGRRLLQATLRLGRELTGHAFRLTCALRKYDVYHEPNFIPQPVDVPTVSTIADLSVLLYPQWHPPERVAYFERHFHRGIQRCDHLLAVSESGRQEIIRHLGVPAERVTRAYNGVRAGLGPMPPERVQADLVRLGLPPRYLLYLGTVEPRKNILTLLRAYCSLPAWLRSRWPLVLAGAWGWKAEEVADYFAAEARQRGVIHLGYVADEHLAALYNGARALLFPSFYEGFGLPPVEMMACGGAVIASTADSLVEVTRPLAHHVEPLDLDGWREAMIRVTTDDDWWRQLRRGTIEHAGQFTWRQSAADTVGVYRLVAGTTPRIPLPLSTGLIQPHRRAG